MKSEQKTKSAWEGHARVLKEEWLGSLRSHEELESTYEGLLESRRKAYLTELKLRNQRAEDLETADGERIAQLRTLRNVLESERLALESLAGAALARLGLEYARGMTAGHLLNALSLSEAEAASDVKLPGSLCQPDLLVRIVKWAGMVGCLFLGTVGMGSLVLHVQPSTIFQSELLPVAVGLACILVGGAFLSVSPLLKRAGAFRALANQHEAHRALMNGAAMTLLMCIVVAFVDAKAITAINASRAMLNPGSELSFSVTLLVAGALSAAYVLGTAVQAFTEGFASECSWIIKAAQGKHLKDERVVVEVTQACEVLNELGVIERRHKQLRQEIKDAEVDFESSMHVIYKDSPEPPTLSDEHEKELKVQKQRVRYAGQKLRALETLVARLGGIAGSEEGRDEAN